jgi:hypothetical protein
MTALGLRRPKKGWQIVHRCEGCGVTKVNRVAEDTVQPDEIDALVALVLR